MTLRAERGVEVWLRGWCDAVLTCLLTEDLLFPLPPRSHKWSAWSAICVNTALAVRWHALLTRRLPLIIVLIRKFGECCLLGVKLLIGFAIAAGRPLKLCGVGFCRFQRLCRFIRNGAEFELYQESWSSDLNENVIKMKEKERGLLYIWSATGWKTEKSGFHSR